MKDYKKLYETFSKAQKKYRESHSEYYKEYHRKWQQENKEKISQYQKEWRQRKKEIDNKKNDSNLKEA